jgi:hypothetical protein
MDTALASIKTALATPNDDIADIIYNHYIKSKLMSLNDVIRMIEDMQEVGYCFVIKPNRGLVAQRC